MKTVETKSKADTSGIHLWLVLWKAFRSVQAHAHRHIACLGLGLSDFGILEVLLHKGPLNVQELGAKVMLTSGSMTAALDRLGRRGLIAREEGVPDRRSRVVRLTEVGTELIREAFEDHKLAMEVAVAGVAKQDREMLIDLLRQLGLGAMKSLGSRRRKVWPRRAAEREAGRSKEMSEMKKVIGVYGPGSNHWVGDGFPVRNMFPSNGLKDEINPFLMLDYAGPEYFEPSKKSHGVGEHPHRGFETVTIAYQGAVSHRDSAGNAGVIFPGDVQWMTAASGVVHEEMHEKEFANKGGTFEMIQLWVNLPKSLKMSRPRYQGITKEQIPSVDLGGGSFARVIAGELSGVRGPASTFTAVNLFDVRLTAGSKVELQIPDGHNTAVLVLKGDVVVNGENSIKGEARIATLSQDGERIVLEAKEDSTLLVLSGEPINEPVFSYGPFVMNTRDEIMQAVRDYNDGKMGHLG